MTEPTKNGILEYLESVSSDNPETFTEYQEGIGREGFRKYIPDPFQVSDYLTDRKNGIRTLAPEDEEAFMDEYYKGKEGQYYKIQESGARYYYHPDGSPVVGMPKGYTLSDVGKDLGKEVSHLFSPESKSETFRGLGSLWRSITNKKANGGSIYEAEKSYDYDPALWGPIAEGIASILLPQDAVDVALMTTPLWWMKSLKTGSKAYKKAEKLQKKVDREKFDYNREMKNAPYDGDPAYQAAYKHDNNRKRYNNQIKKIVEEETLNPPDDDLLRTIVDIVTPD